LADYTIDGTAPNCAVKLTSNPTAISAVAVIPQIN
jgi:hypothetical protein